MKSGLRRGGTVLCLLALATLVRADEAADPLAIYKSGDYARAIPLLQQAVAKNPKDALAQAALLSALVYEGRVDEASDAADDDAQNFPQSPEVLAARGDYEFYMGDVPAAENLYKSALKIKDETARACYENVSHLSCGLALSRRAAALHASAPVRSGRCADHDGVCNLFSW